MQIASVEELIVFICSIAIIVLLWLTSVSGSHREARGDAVAWLEFNVRLL